MENNDSPIKPQPTGGLKLMTVFIAVLALHVLVIGGFTVYHLMSGGTSDTDLLTDKTHKTGPAATDGQTPDASATASTDGSTAIANPPATEPGATTPGTTAPSTTAPATTTAANNGSPAPAAPLQSDLVTSPPDIAPVPPTAAEVASGPVKMPANPPQTQPEVQTSIVSAPATEPAAESDGGTPYVVKPHDSLARIAHHHHITIAELKSANNLTTDFLSINQKLVIPASSTTTVAAASTDASGPIMASTDSTVSSSVPGVKTAKTPKTAKLAATTSASTLHHHVYTVVKGDTLTRIAHKFKTTPNAIMTANNITDPAKLSIGKKLKIPSVESRSAKNTPAPVTQPATVQSGAPTPQLANFIQ